jgi:hypothetical protein
MQYTVNELLKGAQKMAQSVFGKKDEYRLKFCKEEDGRWYVDFPNWPFDHHNLLMVEGADDLCELLSDDGIITEVSVIPAKQREKHDGYFELEQTESSITGGSTYEVYNDEFRQRFNRNDLWLCPVTLFVLGEYPKYIYVKEV